MSNESESTYDVVVIGGGIQGAGVAQAAQAAGYSTLILEKTDWAAGTSSKSSKLIHGGLRYLQSGELSLVQEGLQERALLLKKCTGTGALQLVLPPYLYALAAPFMANLFWSYPILDAVRLSGRGQI